MMWSVVCLVVASCCLGVLSEPEVKTSLGVLKGLVLKSRNGREYNAFMGVPYAKPPLADLRFKAPVRAEPWSGVLNATKKGPKCLQPVYNRFVGQEDCLYLNIFSPKTSASLPVLFYIHGGVFLMGDGGPLEHGAFFMDEDVVLVSIQYRLGIWGFLSMENEELPGNMGMKDMVMALNWVLSEIKSFGGDPNLVTVFGIDAGAAAAHYLCLYPPTRKLVKGCITESGVGGPPWFLKGKGEARALSLQSVKALGCPEDQLLPCLQKKTVPEIMNSSPLNVENGFGPSLEPGASSGEWPKKNADFPWIVGHTANEGVFRAQYIANFLNESAVKLYTENYESYLPEIFHISKSPKENAKRIHERYFTNNDVYKGIEEAHSEGQYIYPVLKAALSHNGPTYFYVFNYTGGPALWEIIMRRNLNITGVGHVDEISYLFEDKRGYKPDGWPSKDDVKFSQKMIKLWANFAKTQKPSIEGEVEWEQFSGGRFLHLSNNGLEMKDYPKKSDMIKFWDSIFG